MHVHARRHRLRLVSKCHHEQAEQLIEDGRWSLGLGLTLAEPREWWMVDTDLVEVALPPNGNCVEAVAYARALVPLLCSW